MNQRLLCILLLVGAVFAPMPRPAGAAGTTYYVSSSDGSDDNDGLSELAPFETIAKVNALDLEPGDQVLFKYGDTWQAEQLVIAASGTKTDPIVFGSYPEGCTDKPILSGSLPITGWTVHSGDVVPSGLDYVSGTLRASSGTWDDALAPTLTWTGVLTPSPTITITYAVTVPYVVSGTATLTLPQDITNAAITTVPGYEPIVRTAVIIVNPHKVHLPLMLKENSL